MKFFEGLLVIQLDPRTNEPQRAVYEETAQKLSCLCIKLKKKKKKKINTFVFILKDNNYKLDISLDVFI